MAEYKRGFKRQGNDRFTSYIFIGFVIAFFVLIVSIILFNVFNKELDYSSFDYIEDYQEITTMPEDEYLVYFYSEGCGHCQQIKYDVLEFADDNNENIKVYFLDAGIASGYNNISGMNGTPSVLLIVDGQLIDLVAGDTSILSLFDQVNGGTYLYLD
ncbi:MAG: thioredoxin family protein [Candidatus Izimaplasma sp.]|nr:thioredoxin family protein [Candidatus Izimaplasma bacterium]